MRERPHQLVLHFPCMHIRQSGAYPTVLVFGVVDKSGRHPSTHGSVISLKSHIFIFNKGWVPGQQADKVGLVVRGHNTGPGS